MVCFVTTKVDVVDNDDDISLHQQLGGNCSSENNNLVLHLIVDNTNIYQHLGGVNLSHGPFHSQ